MGQQQGFQGRPYVRLCAAVVLPQGFILIHAGGENVNACVWVSMVEGACSRGPGRRCAPLVLGTWLMNSWRKSAQYGGRILYKVVLIMRNCSSEIWDEKFHARQI